MESPRQLDPAALKSESDDRADGGADESRAEAAEARSEASPPERGATLWGEPLRRLTAVVLVLFAVAAAITAPVALRVKGISPFDEATHIDYAYQVAHGHIPARGSVIAPVIRADMLCRGPANRKVQLRRCGETNPPAKTFTAGAQDYNFGHPPLYYAITGVLARAVNLPLSGEHFIALARLTGVLWLFAAMLVLYLALRRLRVRWQLALCGGLLLAVTPAVFYLDATVSNDAAAALCGSLAVLTLARIATDDKLGWKLPALLTFLAAATKVISALPFLAVAAVLLALALRERTVDKERAKRLVFIAIGIVVAFGVVYVGWAYFQRHRGLANWVSPIAGVSTRPVTGLPFDELFGTSFSGVGLLSSGYLPLGLGNGWMLNLQRILGPLSVAGIATVLAMNRPWSPRFTVAATAVLGVLSYPFVVQVQALVSDHVYFNAVVSRYGISVIPFLVASIALAADDRRLVKSMVGFTGLAVLIALYTAV